MSSVVQAKCPNCKHQITVEEIASEQPVTCSSCQHTFVPSVVIAESNKRFEIAMYVGMLVVGLGLVVYMAMTGNLKPKPDADEAAPAAVDTDNAVDGTPVKPEDIGIPETADDEVDIVEP